MTHEEAAYLAGIIDGDGSIGWNNGCLQLTVTSTDSELIYWVHNRTGAGTVSLFDRKDGVRKRAYYWRCFSDAARYVISLILPYMVIERKRVLAMRALNDAPNNRQLQLLTKQQIEIVKKDRQRI